VVRRVIENYEEVEIDLMGEDVRVVVVGLSPCQLESEKIECFLDGLRSIAKLERRGVLPGVLAVRGRNRGDGWNATDLTCVPAAVHGKG
jgi:hypothetical protein